MQEHAWFPDLAGTSWCSVREILYYVYDLVMHVVKRLEMAVEKGLKFAEWEDP